jgi:chromosomal replication initiator protein
MGTRGTATGSQTGRRSDVSCIEAGDPQLARLADAIAQRVGAQRFHTWFDNSTRLGLRGDGLEISVPNDFISEWISQHYTRSIQEAANEVLGCELSVRFSVMPQLFDLDGATKTGEEANAGPRAGSNGTSREARMNAAADRVASATEQAAGAQSSDPNIISNDMGHPQPGIGGGNGEGAAGAIGETATRGGLVRNGTGLTRESGIAALKGETAPIGSRASANAPLGRSKLRHELESYVVGSGNQIAFNAVSYVAEYPGGQYNPLFIHGSCGLGKTHLLQGLCRRFIEFHPTLRWAYLTGEDFTNEFVTALRSNKMDIFRRKMREVDLLVIDDVHFMGGRKATQEEFLHTFNAIEAMGRQVVMASDNHPKMIEQLGESLTNRFVSGMVVRIDPPNYATRCEILRAKSLRSGLGLSEEVIGWVARRVTQNVRELEGAITRIAAQVHLTGRPADVAMAQDALGDLDRQHGAPVHPENVLKSVCEYFGLEHKDLLSSRRQRTISLARSVAMYLVRKTAKLSFPEIGSRMGKRNHSTVISACRRIEKAVSLNTPLVWTSAVGERTEEATELIQRLEEHSRSLS